MVGKQAYNQYVTVWQTYCLPERQLETPYTSLKTPKAMHHLTFNPPNTRSNSSASLFPC